MYFVVFVSLVDKVTTFAEFTLRFLKENFALPGPIQFRDAGRIPCSQLLHAVREFAPGLIRTISFLNIVSAQFDLEFLALEVDWVFVMVVLTGPVTVAGLEGISFAVLCLFRPFACRLRKLSRNVSLFGRFKLFPKALLVALLEVVLRLARMSLVSVA